MRLVNPLRSFVRENKILVFQTVVTTASTSATILVLAYSLKLFSNVLSLEQMGLILTCSGLLFQANEISKQNLKSKKEEEVKQLNKQKQEEEAQKERAFGNLDLKFVGINQSIKELAKATDQSIKELTKAIDDRFDDLEAKVNAHTALSSHPGILEDVKKLKDEIDQVAVDSRYAFHTATDAKEVIDNLQFGALQSLLQSFTPPQSKTPLILKP